MTKSKIRFNILLLVILLILVASIYKMRHYDDLDILNSATAAKFYSNKDSTKDPLPTATAATSGQIAELETDPVNELLSKVEKLIDSKNADFYEQQVQKLDQHKNLENEISYQRQNATILTLCRNEDLYSILTSIRELEDRFNNKFHYDWVFLNNEEFSDEFKLKTSNTISGKTKYGVIPKEHWSYPDDIDLTKAAEKRKELAGKGVIYASSESYRHMCRFNSGFFYKHPILKDYKYYWRVEPDVKFYCDINTDPFKYMADHKKTYGFTISIHEFGLTIPTLWETTRSFLEAHPNYIAKDNLMKFISNDDGLTYNLCHFWSNFEIADMDFWRSEAYEAYFNHLDKSGGFFYERWGDAPVHSIAAALFLQKDEIHYFEDIAYRHGVYGMCPIDESIWLNNNCNCNPSDDFTFQKYSCGVEYYDSQGLTKPKDWEAHNI
ncbi:unnamed protein product [[Candida] boidinii]|uniref:Unnamed protein product n=1 Tax=Candida boidinii TaxID=5477 RepID=A0A9W6WB94_CANBO|nr:hypothetical protein B5S30_g4465 [[Candida] boidinii]OWB86002.1 hypothetical protein B5S33_g4680 [[Candida] boidinii]GME73981.1 unnamed protein product [[Candida] boidinii]